MKDEGTNKVRYVMRDRLHGKEIRRIPKGKHGDFKHASVPQTQNALEPRRLS
jgi:hypothetical protein